MAYIYPEFLGDGALEFVTWELLHVFNMLLWRFSQAYLYVAFLCGLIDQLLWICRIIVYELCNTDCGSFIIIIIIKQEL
jgi:hypothetical protein